MLAVSCKGHPPAHHPPPPRTLHLRTSEKRGVLHRMEVLSHLSHLQSPLPGQRGWSLVSNYPTILQPPAHGADPPPWYSIKQYNSAFDNRRIILLAWVQCNKRWRGQPGSNLGNDSVCRRRCHSNIIVEDSLVKQYTFSAKYKLFI